MWIHVRRTILVAVVIGASCLFYVLVVLLNCKCLINFSDEAYGAHILTSTERIGRHPLLRIARQNSQSMANLRQQMHRDHPSPLRTNQRHRIIRRRSSLHRLRRRHRPRMAAQLLHLQPAPLPHHHPPHQIIAGQNPSPNRRRWGPLRRLHRRVPLFFFSTF